MENRAYTFAFLGVLAIVCLGAYVAVSALFDQNGDPLIRFTTDSATPTIVALATRPGGTRTPTPTNTPYFFVIPTIIFPTATDTPLPPTDTPTLPPFPSPRPLPTNTPVPLPSGSPPPAQTNTPQPGSFAYEPMAGPAVDPTRQCIGQYYIYGTVRDAQNQPIAGVRIHYATQTKFPPSGITEAKGYELTVGTADTEWFVTIVDSSDRPLSPTVSVHTSGLQAGNCWYLLNWRRNS